MAGDASPYAARFRLHFAGPEREPGAEPRHCGTCQHRNPDRTACRPSHDRDDAYHFARAFRGTPDGIPLPEAPDCPAHEVSRG